MILNKVQAKVFFGVLSCGATIDRLLRRTLVRSAILFSSEETHPSRLSKIISSFCPSKEGIVV